MLELRLLGPPSLQRDGAVVALAVRKSMALLLLLARSPAPLPRARVAAMLWPDLDPATGRRNLRRELARLRECGAEDAVEAAGEGLALAGAMRVDAVAFAAALAASRPDEALALWHGPPADGFALGDADAFDEWLSGERAELGELRRQALQLSAAALEAGGDMAGALARVQTLLADDPLQEQHHRDAMRLLSASGRREAALAQFERCRALLRTELGLAPMAETEALASSLRGVPRNELGSVPRSVLTAARGAGLLPEQLPFVGRVDAVAALEASWTTGRPIVIEGEAGMGKTRLATDFAAAHGPYALARCRAGDAEVPYASFTRALRVLLGAATVLPPEVAAWMTPEVARLLPELGAAGAPMRTDDERSRFFEACASTWQALSADDFDAVIIDDWHLADSASRSLLAFVVRRRCEAGGSGAREIFAMRPDLDDDAIEALAALRTSTAATHLRLQALSGDEVFGLVQRLSGAGEPTRFARRLERATGGNPFFLAETLRHLVDGELLTTDAAGGWQTPFDASTEDYREMPVPASVQEAVRARAGRLTPAARRVLEAAALATEPFSPRLLAPACALSELETVLAIETAVAAHLLREHELGGFAFAHDLVQQSIAGALSAERARLVHRRLALGGEAAGAPPAAIAAHHEASGDAQRAVPYRLAAGDEAQRLRALPDAMAHWRKALADGPSTAQALLLHERLGKAAYERTDYAALREQAEALARLRHNDAPSAAERVDLDVARSLALARNGSSSSVEALALLDALPPSLAGRQRVEACLARVVACSELGRIEEATNVVRTALALPELTDDERGELLGFAFSCDMNAGRGAAALGHAEAALVLARQIGDSTGVARSHFRRGLVMLSTDDIAGAERELLLAARMAGQLGLVQIERFALYNLTCVYAPQGRPAEALAVAERGWNLAPPLEASDFRVMYRLAMLDAHVALGDLGAAWRIAVPAIDEALDLGDPRVRIGAVSCALELLGLLGESARGRRLLASVDVAAARELKGSADEMWIVVAQFEARQGDLAAASRALAELAASGPVAEPRVRVLEAHARAELALAQGDVGTALALLPADDAAGMSSELRTRGLALRVAAEARLGRFGEATVDAVQEALAASAGHALADLELRSAWARAAVAGVPGAAASATDELADHAAQLAATLQDSPAQRAAFSRLATT